MSSAIVIPIVIKVAGQMVTKGAGGVLSKKFGWRLDDIAEARKWITGIARTATPALQLNVIGEDPADDRILECAVAAGADYIVSGDNDSLRLGQYDGIPVMNPSDFLTLFQSREHER